MCRGYGLESYPVVGYDVAPRNPRNFNMVKTVEQAVTFADIIFENQLHMILHMMVDIRQHIYQIKILIIR